MERISKMELESGQQSAIYGYLAATTAVTFGGIILGYFMGRLPLKSLLRRDSILAHLKDTQITGKDQIELKKLEYDEKEREHQRHIELKGIEHGKSLETLAKEHGHELAIFRELASLRPVIESYLADVEAYATAQNHETDPELLKQRQRYREELVEEFKEDAEEYSNGFFGSDFTIRNEDTEKIDRMVNMKYPLSSAIVPEMPARLQKIIDLVTEERRKIIIVP